MRRLRKSGENEDEIQCPGEPIPVRRGIDLTDLQMKRTKKGSNSDSRPPPIQQAQAPPLPKDVRVGTPPDRKHFGRLVSPPSPAEACLIPRPTHPSAPPPLPRESKLGRSGRNLVPFAPTLTLGARGGRKMTSLAPVAACTAYTPGRFCHPHRRHKPDGNHGGQL